MSYYRSKNHFISCYSLGINFCNPPHYFQTSSLPMRICTRPGYSYTTKAFAVVSQIRKEVNYMTDSLSSKLIHDAISLQSRTLCQKQVLTLLVFSKAKIAHLLRPKTTGRIQAYLPINFGYQPCHGQVTTNKSRPFIFANGNGISLTLGFGYNSDAGLRF